MQDSDVDEQLLASAVAPGWKLLIEASGQHGSEARIVRGESVVKRRRARDVAGLTPVQGMASLLSMGLSAEQFPKVSTVVGARKRKLSHAQQSSSSMARASGLWVNWLLQRVHFQE